MSGMKNPAFCIFKNKGTDQLGSNHPAYQRLYFCNIVHSFYFLNPKFHVTRNFLWLHSRFCVGPGWKPRRQFFHDMAHINPFCFTIFQALHELKDSVAEKDSRLTSLNIQLEETENQLQRTRQDLYIEQEHTAELEAEVRTRQNLYIEQEHTAELEAEVRTRQNLYIEQEHTAELEAEVRTRQDLYIEQEHTAELKAEVKTGQDLYIEQEHTAELEAEVTIRQDLYIEQEHTAELEATVRTFTRSIYRTGTHC